MTNQRFCIVGHSSGRPPQVQLIARSRALAQRIAERLNQEIAETRFEVIPEQSADAPTTLSA